MSAPGSFTTSDYLPYEDYKRLVQTLINEKKYWWACYCVLSFCTGLRYSDVCRLRWVDILNQRKIIITAQKTKKTHVIPIGKNAASHFEELYIKMGKPKKSNYILESKKLKDNKVVSIQYINRTLKSWVKKYELNIDNFSTHTFRKTFGRYVYEHDNCSEKSLLLLNQIFKHSSLTTTKIYLGIREEEVSSIFSSIVI